MSNSYKIITHKSKKDYVCELILNELFTSEPSKIETIIIMDRSGSMGGAVPKLINGVFPIFFNKLKYNQNDTIHLITFDSRIEHLTLQVNQFKNHSISARGSTLMQEVVNELKSLFNSGKQKFRILSISDGDVWDQQATLDSK